MDLKRYFQTHELVGRKTYELLGEEAWQVFDTDTLQCLLIMREGINKPFYVNNWAWGGDKQERGFRSNVQSLSKGKTLANQLYLSGHIMGKAVDFVVKGMTAEQARDWIEANGTLFPCKVRLEDKDKNLMPISWVHFDTKYQESNPKVYRFNA